MAWPEVVPILSANDICKGPMYDGEKACLWGWTCSVFKGEQQRLYVDTVVESLCGQGMAHFNENARNSKAKIASVWNHAMAKLGYTEPCDYEG